MTASEKSPAAEIGQTIAVSDSEPSEPLRLAHVADGFTLADAGPGETPSRASPEPVTDLQGHYVGPASGLSFLARVRKRLHYSDHASSSFTFGDAPLPEYDPTPSVMVSAEDASLLVQKFFEFTVPIDRLVHRPTIESWWQEFNQTMGSMNDPENAPARRAILWMIFAMAQEHMPQEAGARNDDRRYVAILSLIELLLRCQ